MSPAVKAAVIPIGHQNPMMDVFDRECKQLGGGGDSVRHLRKATRDRRSARHFFKYGLLVASMSAAAPSCGIYGISLVRRHKHNRIISGAGRARDSDGVFAVLHSTAPFLRGLCVSRVQPREEHKRG